MLSHHALDFGELCIDGDRLRTLRDGGIGILEAMSGERADDRAAFADASALDILQQTCERYGRRGLTKDAFEFRERLLRAQELFIAALVEPAPGLALRVQRQRPGGRIADAYGRCDRFRILDRFSSHARRRAGRLIADHDGAARRDLFAMKGALAVAVRTSARLD